MSTCNSVNLVKEEMGEKQYCSSVKAPRRWSRIMWASSLITVPGFYQRLAGFAADKWPGGQSHSFSLLFWRLEATTHRFSSLFSLMSKKECIFGNRASTPQNAGTLSLLFIPPAHLLHIFFSFYELTFRGYSEASIWRFTAVNNKTQATHYIKQ